MALHPGVPAVADLLQRILARPLSYHLQVVCHWARGLPLKLFVKCAQSLWGGRKDMVHVNNQHAPRFVEGKRQKMGNIVGKEVKQLQFLSTPGGSFILENCGMKLTKAEHMLHKDQKSHS